MKKCCFLFSAGLFLTAAFFSTAPAQEKKVERIRLGGGSASATQMSMWLAKEGNFYEKHGLDAETISIPGSSLALQAMLAGEVPVIQLGRSKRLHRRCYVEPVKNLLWSRLACSRQSRSNGGDGVLE